MNYYFLKDTEKVGPLSLEELKEAGLEKDTLIWYEGIEDWTKLIDIPKLRKEILGVEEVPPPLPEEVVKQAEVKAAEEVKKEKKKTKRSRRPLRVAVSIVLIFLLIPSIAIVHSYYTITNEIDNIFGDKNHIIVGMMGSTEGSIYPLEKPSKASPLYEAEVEVYKKAKERGVQDFFEPKFDNNIELYDLTPEGYLAINTPDGENTHFIIYELKKEGDGFILTQIKSISNLETHPLYSASLEYKVKKYSYPSSPHFKSSAFRKTRMDVRKCFKSAFQYLLTEEGSTSVDLYHRLASFTFLRSSIGAHGIKNVKRPTSPYYSWSSKGSVYNDEYIIYYDRTSYYYEVKLRKPDAVKGVFLIFFIGGLFFAIPTFFILRWRQNRKKRKMKS